MAEQLQFQRPVIADQTGKIDYNVKAGMVPTISPDLRSFMSGPGQRSPYGQQKQVTQEEYNQALLNQKLHSGMTARRSPDDFTGFDFNNLNNDIAAPIFGARTYSQWEGEGPVEGRLLGRPFSRTFQGRAREYELRAEAAKNKADTWEQQRLETSKSQKPHPEGFSIEQMLLFEQQEREKAEILSQQAQVFLAQKDFMNHFVRRITPNQGDLIFAVGPRTGEDKESNANIVLRDKKIMVVNPISTVHPGESQGAGQSRPLSHEAVIASIMTASLQGWSQFIDIKGPNCTQTGKKDVQDMHGYAYVERARWVAEQQGMIVRSMGVDNRYKQPKSYDYRVEDPAGMMALKREIKRLGKEYYLEGVECDAQSRNKLINKMMKDLQPFFKRFEQELTGISGDMKDVDPNKSGYIAQLKLWVEHCELPYALWENSDDKKSIESSYKAYMNKENYTPQQKELSQLTSTSIPDRFYPEQVQDQVFEKIEQRADALLDIADLSGSEKASRRQDIASEINDERRSLNDEAQKVQANIADLSQSQADLQSGVIGEFQEVEDIYEQLQQAYKDNLPKIAGIDKTGLLAEILGLELPAVTLEDLHSMDLGKLFNSEHKQAVLDAAQEICVEAAQDYLDDRSALKIATQQHAEKEQQLEAVKTIALGLLSDLREAREGLAEANNMANDARENLARLSEEQPQFEQRIQDIEAYSEGLGRKIDTLNATIAQAEENPSSLAAAILPELHAERLALTKEQGATDRQADALQQERAETIQQYENQLNEAVHARIPFLEARLQGWARAIQQYKKNQLEEAVPARIPFLEARLQGWDAENYLTQNEGLEAKVQAIQEQVVTVHTELSAAKQELEQAKNRLKSSKQEFKDTMADRKAAKLYVDMAETITAVAEKLTPEFFTQLQAATIQHEDISARLDEQSSRLEAIGSRDAELVEKLAAIQVVDNIGSEYRPLVNARGEAEEIRLPQSFIDQRSLFTEILGDAHGWWMADTINKDISRLLDKTTAFGEQVREHLSNDDHVLAAGHRVVTDEAQIGHLGVFADNYNRLVMEYEQRFDNLQNGMPRAQEALTQFIRDHSSRIAEMENTLNVQASGANLFAVALSLSKGIPSPVDEWQDAASYNPPAARLIEINNVLEKVINESPDLDVVRTAYLTRHKMHDNARYASEVLTFDGVLGGITPEKLEQALTDSRHGAANAIKLLDHIEAFIDQDFDAPHDLKAKAEPKFSYEKAQPAIPVLGRKPSAARGATMH
ncbi:MAG: hypothetical protein ACOYK8_05140 [Alphaproteobacteria bacterium]